MTFTRGHFALLFIDRYDRLTPKRLAMKRKRTAPAHSARTKDTDPDSPDRPIPVSSALIQPDRLRASVAVTLVLAVAIRWWAFDVTYFRSDELVYTHYASRISEAGISQFRALAEAYASNPSLWAFPNPLRVLYILLTALSCRVAGACSGTSVAAVSLLSGIALVLLTLVMAWRMFGERVALLSGLLIAFSPLQLALSRRAWQDGFFSLTVLLALWAFWERSRSPRREWDVLLGGALLTALLTKESALIFLLGFLGVLLYTRLSDNVPIARSTLWALLLPLPLAIAVILALIPDPSLLIRVYRGWLAAVEKGEFAIAYSRGPWFRYLIDFLLLSPPTTLLAIGYYFMSSAEQGDRFLGRSTLILFAVFSLLTLKNVRYVSFLDIPIRILAALTLTAFSQRPPFAWAGWRVAVVGVTLLAAYDLSMFHAIFVSGGIYDPVTENLAKAEHLIP